MSTLEYLKQIAKIQREVMVLENSINFIDKELPKLAIRYPIKKPHCNNSTHDTLLLIFKCFLKWIEYTLSVGVLAVIITFIAAWVLGINHYEILFCILFIIVMILAFVVVSDDFSKQKEHDKNLQDTYNYKVSIQEKRVQKEAPIKAKMLKERPKLIEHYIYSKEILDKLYELKINGEFILYPKYRNIVPVSMFIDYLASHRCEKLEGHEGAYNLYENELRLNSIITNQKIII